MALPSEVLSAAEYRPVTRLASLGEMIGRAQECLLGMQGLQGEWCGELEGDSILESEFILLAHTLGRIHDPLTLKVAAYLRRLQTPGGGWTPYPGAPIDVSATVKAYFALKLIGDDPAAPHMERAAATARELGGVAACNSFTKIYLAILGQFPWKHVPAIPPELMLLPPRFYVNIYAMSSWSRTILVPLTIIWAKRPVYPVPAECCIEELFVEGRSDENLRLRTQAPFPSWKHFFLLVDRVLKGLDALPLKPWRQQSLRKAERWMKERFNRSAGLGAIFPPIVNAIWALMCLGYDVDGPEIQSQLAELHSLIIEEDDDARMQPCTSPVWDTALAIISLEESGLDRDHPALQSAQDWIVDHEVTEGGDWQVARPHLQPGGWYFEYANEFYPDVDDTGMVMIALDRLDRELNPVKQRALDWVIGMQCRNGGWASFDADNDRALLCEVPYADHNAMIDPPTSDITGRILEMLGAYGYNKQNEVAARAIEFLRTEQEPDGSWFGRWGVNYIYGTWQVLKGLAAVGVDPGDPMMRRGVEWLRSTQQENGGWGESCESYDDPASRGQGPVTASQTAWALMGLIAAGEAHSKSVEKGIEYLVRTQGTDGNWPEPEFTGTGFPRVFYLKYHLYRLYFPLFALGMYGRAIGTILPRHETTTPHGSAQPILQTRGHIVPNGRLK